VALKQVIINYTLDKEKHSVEITDCCDPCYKKTRIMELPLLKDKCNSCADVAIKIKDSSLVVPTCGAIPQRIILGRIIDYFQLVDANGCPLSEFKITIEYDDTQLTDPEVGLAPCDIDGFDCYTIATAYLKGIVDCVNEGTTLTQNLTTGVITYTNGAGDVFTANVRSTNANNLLSIGTDGGCFLDDGDTTKTRYAVDTNLGAVSIDVDAAATYTINTGAVITVVNPSAVALMRIIRTYVARVGGEFRPGHLGTIKLQISVDAAPYVDFDLGSWENTGTISYNGRVPVELVNTSLAAANIAASADYAIQLRLQYITLTTGAGGSGPSVIGEFVNTYALLGIVGDNA